MNRHIHLAWLLIATAACCAAPSPASARIIYVNASASAGGDGNSWSTAYQHLQTALANAVGGDEIWVARGTYMPDGGRIPFGDNHVAGSGDRTATFSLINNVAIYGGFIGSETLHIQRNPSQNISTLSGDLSGDDPPAAGTTGENSYRVVRASGNNASAIIDGFLITSGNGNGGDGFRAGGGLQVFSGPSATIANCVFLKNTSTSGGGASVGQFSAPKFVNCKFLQNTATGAGGAVSITIQSNPVFVNCLYNNNSGSPGSAIRNIGSSSFVNSTFFHNVSGNAAVYATNESGGFATLTNCVFWDNGVNPIQGGAAAVAFSDVQGGYAGTGNLDVDPRFVDADGADNVVGTEDDNLRLAQCSPCVDAGDNAALPADFADLDGDGNTTEVHPLDLDSQPRQVDIPAVADTGAGTPPLVDMGAYEAYSTAVTVIYVNASASGPTHDGSSWTSAFLDLQEALTLAANLVCSFSNVEIWVARGTYMPNGGYTRFGDPPSMHVNGSGLPGATFNLVSRVALYGGFNGAETMLGQRNVTANVTTLSGDLGDNDDIGITTDNAFQIVKATFTDNTARIDGFTITKGLSPMGGEWGAGMAILASDVIVVNCRFVSNTASAGGGLRIGGLSNPVIANCLFLRNYADGFGGGAYVYNTSGVVQFVNCVFARNNGLGGGGGGGIYIALAGQVLIFNCTFTRNFAGNAGGGGLGDNGNLPTAVKNCIFWGNTASIGGQQIDGGGVQVSYSCVQPDAPEGPVFPGMGNIKDYPNFFLFGTNSDDLHVSLGSPCIDAGSTPSVPSDAADLDANGNTVEPTPLDLDNRPRFADDPFQPDTGQGPQPVVDMGAYESARPDCDDDDVPNECEILGCPAGCPAGCIPRPDCNQDGFPDHCQVPPLCAACPDCNSNGVPDDCDAAASLVMSQWRPTTPLPQRWSSPGPNAAANWCPGLVPNNGGGHTYDVTILGNSPLCTLNTNPTISALTIEQGGVLEVNVDSESTVRTLAVESSSATPLCSQTTPTASTIENAGTIRAKDGKRLLLDVANIVQCPTGRLEAVGVTGQASKIQINGQRVSGGTAFTSGDSAVIELLGGAVLDGVTVEGNVISTAATVSVPTGQTGIVENTITNLGLIEVAKNTSTIATFLSPSDAGASFSGTGCVVLKSRFARLGEFKGFLTNGAGHCIEGAGRVFGTFTNELGATVTANNTTNALTLSAPGPKANDGLCQALDGGRLSVEDDVAGSGAFVADAGTISLPGTSPITVAGSTLDVLNGGAANLSGAAQMNIASHVRLACGPLLRGCSPPILSCTGNARMTVGENLEVMDGGQASFGGTAQINIANHVRLFCSANLRGCSPPILSVTGNAGVTVGGDFFTDGAVSVTSTTPVTLAGNFDNQATMPTLFDWETGPLTMNGVGPQSFELAGQDLGPSDPAGFVNNFAMGTLRVEAGRTVDFFDNFDNSPGSGCEALYVDRLELGAGATIRLHGCPVYYANIVQDGAATIVLKGGGLFLSTHVGDLDDDGDIDLNDLNQFTSLLLGNLCNLTCIARADTNGDNFVNGADIANFVRLLAGW